MAAETREAAEGTRETGCMMLCRISKVLIVLLTMASLSATLYAESARKLVAQGNHAYKAGEYDKALAKYKEAQQAGGAPGVVEYNLGNAHYRLGESEPAQQAYGLSLSPRETEDNSASLYNLGNAFFQGQKFEEAVSAYIEALKRNPSDENARYNLELARRMLNQAQQQQNQPDEQQENQEQDKEQQQEDEQKEQEQQDEQPPEEQKEEEQEQKPQESQQREMTPEEAERLLNALLQDEQNTLKEVKKQKAASRPKREKDW